jgi:hypothetical protein
MSDPHASGGGSGKGIAIAIGAIVGFVIFVNTVNTFVRTVRGDPDPYVAPVVRVVTVQAAVTSSVRHFDDRNGGIGGLTKWCASEGGHIVDNQCIRDNAPAAKVQTATSDGVKYFNDQQGGLGSLTAWCRTQGGHMAGNQCIK